MNFPTAIKTCYGKYATFSGRASRSEYWFFLLFLYVAIFALAIVSAVFSGPDIGTESSPGGSAAIGLVGVLAMIMLLGSFLPLLAVSVRRIHDTGASGWWVLLWTIGLVSLIWACIPGQPGNNRFGPDPLAKGPTPT